MDWRARKGEEGHNQKIKFAQEIINNKRQQFWIAMCTYQLWLQNTSLSYLWSTVHSKIKQFSLGFGSFLKARTAVCASTLQQCSIVNVPKFGIFRRNGKFWIIQL